MTEFNKRIEKKDQSLKIKRITLKHVRLFQKLYSNVLKH